MIIDFHTHIFPDRIAERAIHKLETNANTKAFLDGTEADLYRSMEKNGIDISVVLPVVTDPGQTKSVNRFAVELTEKYKNHKTSRFVSFGGVHPKSPTLKEDIIWIKEHGLKGIKLHPDYQDTYFDDPVYEEIIGYAEELDLITVVHAGRDLAYPDDVHCTPEMSAKLIDRLHPKKLVLAHTGGNEMWDESEKILAGLDVYMDISYTLHKISPEQLLRIVKKHGAGKILFGTDSPWGGQGEILAAFENVGFSPEEKEAILWENAVRLLEL